MLFVGNDILNLSLYSALNFVRDSLPLYHVELLFQLWQSDLIFIEMQTFQQYLSQLGFVTNYYRFPQKGFW